MKPFPFNAKSTSYVKKLFALSTVIGILGWTVVASANPISYTDTHYYASARILHIDGVPEGSVQEGSQPPVEVHLSFPYSGSANVVIPNNSNLYADVANNSLLIDSESIPRSTYRFTADFPQISISYDYHITVYAYAGFTGYGSASGEILSSLFDITDNMMVWYFNPKLTAYYNDGEKSTTEIISKLLDLVDGHAYELRLDIASVYARANLADANGHVSIDNIVVDAIPLPGAMLLLGSGLFCIVGWRTFRK